MSKPVQMAACAIALALFFFGIRGGYAQSGDAHLTDVAEVSDALAVEGQAPGVVASASAASPRHGVGAASAASVSSASVPEKPKAKSQVSGLGPVPDLVVRDTPRDTTSGFLEAIRGKDYERAAYYLYLGQFPPSQQKEKGVVLAHKLGEVLESKVWLDMESISDDPFAGADKPETAVREIQIAKVPMPGGDQGIRLTRVQEGIPAKSVWLFSPSTVRSIDGLYEVHGPPAFLDRVPQWMKDSRILGIQIWQWMGLVVLVVGSLLAGLVSERVSVFVLSKTNERSRLLPENGLIDVIRGPMRLLVAFALALGFCPSLRLTAGSTLLLERVLYVGIIYAVMKGSVRLVTYLAAVVQDQTIKDIEEQTKARAIATRVTTVRRIANVLVVVIGFSLALMQFPAARAAGLSLLGSAGLAGAILGFAAQKTFSNLFAGILISLTQPIRIGDSVSVEGEFGTIEEIGATHVVVRIWDFRRLVVPVTYFLDKHFENWTRKETELLGTVFIHADYRTRADDIRVELDRILEGETAWNGKTKTVVVHELNDRVAVFRILLSADDADKLFAVRCLVREKMLSFLQSNVDRLPVRRVENR